MTMKVAIPTNDDSGIESRLAGNYSKCKYFVLVSLDDGKISGFTTIRRELPDDVNGIKGAEAFLLAGKGVNAVIAGKIPEKNRLSLVGNNIRVFLGASGMVSSAVKQYLDGKLEEKSSCKEGDICEC